MVDTTKKTMSQEQKNKIAFGKFLKKESKTFQSEKHADKVPVSLYNELVAEFMLLREVVKSLVSEKEAKEELESAIEKAQKEVIGTRVEEVQAPKIDSSIDVGSVERVTKVGGNSGPDVKRVTLNAMSRSSDTSDMNIVYSTISVRKQDSLGLSWALERGVGGNAIRYIEQETLNKRLSSLAKQGVTARANKGLKESVPAHSELRSLAIRYNNGFLVLSDNKKKSLGIM